MTGTESDGTSSIPISADDASVVGDVIADLGDVEISAPADVFESIIGSDDSNSLRLTQAQTDDTVLDDVKSSIGDDNAVIVSFELSLEKIYSNGNVEQIHEFSEDLKVTIDLTAEQISEITDMTSARLYWYNPDTGELTDMNATFDLEAGTATFYTDHFSTFVIANVINEDNVTTYNPAQPVDIHIVIMASAIAGAVILLIVIIFLSERRKKNDDTTKN